MNSNEVNRRQIIIAAASAGLGTLVPHAAAQQAVQKTELPFRPTEIGPIHGDMVAKISEALGGTDLDSKEGLLKIISLLRQLAFINEPEAKLLSALVEALYAYTDIEAMRKAIEAIHEEAKAKARDVTVAIASIAVNSVQYVQEKIRSNRRAIYIVSADVSSALLGAVSCAKLGPTLAVVGVLAGAVAGSSEAAFGSQR